MEKKEVKNSVISKEIPLEKSLYSLKDSYSVRDINRFMYMVEKGNLPWFEYQGTIWVPSKEVCLAKGVYIKCYVLNWRNKSSLRGRELKLEKEDLRNVLKIIRIRHPDYKKKKEYRQQLFIEWIRAVDFFYYEEDSITLIDSEFLNTEGGLLIDSRFLAKKIEYTHRSITKLIDKYQDALLKFGGLHKRRDKTKSNIGEIFYILSEDQCYFLLSVLRNNQNIVDFKVWFINHLRSSRLSIGPREGTEKDFQESIVRLSSYCSLKVRSEVIIDDSFSRGPNKTRRIDLLIEDSIAIEMKKDMISASVVLDVLGNKGYVSLLENTFHSFRTLVLCGPKGISPEAKRLISPMRPKVIFMTLNQVSSLLAEACLRETPTSGHWWLYNFIFPQFKNILPDSYLKKNLSILSSS